MVVIRVRFLLHNHQNNYIRTLMVQWRVDISLSMYVHIYICGRQRAGGHVLCIYLAASALAAMS